MAVEVAADLLGLLVVEFPARLVGALCAEGAVVVAEDFADIAAGHSELEGELRGR